MAEPKTPIIRDRIQAKAATFATIIEIGGISINRKSVPCQYKSCRNQPECRKGDALMKWFNPVLLSIGEAKFITPKVPAIIPIDSIRKASIFSLKDHLDLPLTI